MRIIKILIFLFISINTYSQSIVNTEKALPTANKKFALVSDFSTTSNSGNLNIFRLTSGLSVGAKLDSVNTLRIISGLTMLHVNGDIVKDVAYGQLRHNLVISNRLQLANFYQAQYNNNLVLDARQLLGSGFRVNLRAKDSVKFRIFTFLGVMYEKEQLNRTKIPETEESLSNLVRSATNVVLRYDNNKFHAVSITYYQVHMLNINDFRLLNDTELLVDVTDKLSLNLMFQYRYDSRPPSVLVRNDFMHSIGLTFKM